MIKRLVLATLLALSFHATAQETETPNEDFIIGGKGHLNFSNTGYGDYYAGGGLGSTTINAQANAYGNKLYGNGKSWTNDLRIEYGLGKFENTNGENFTKSSDVIDFTSKFGTPVKQRKEWSYSVAFNFLSQFTDTNTAWNEKENEYSQLVGTLPSATNLGTVQSTLLSPADFTLGFGFDYKPNENFSAFIGPLASKLRVISDDNIAKSGLYGNEVRSLTDFDNTRLEAGANVITNYKNSFLHDDMLSFQTDLKLFSNYLDEPANVDVNWNTTTSLNPWKFIEVIFSTSLAYDDDKSFTSYADGELIGSTDKGIQFKNVLGVGLTHKFGAEKK